MRKRSDWHKPILYFWRQLSWQTSCWSKLFSKINWKSPLVRSWTQTSYPQPNNNRPIIMALTVIKKKKDKNKTASTINNNRIIPRLRLFWWVGRFWCPLSSNVSSLACTVYSAFFRGEIYPGCHDQSNASPYLVSFVKVVKLWRTSHVKSWPVSGQQQTKIILTAFV